MPLHRIPVVAGLAYMERARRLPSSFTAQLSPEPDNPYFREAIAVVSSGEKIGYLAPEVSREYGAAIAARSTTSPMMCPARRALPADHQTSGVEWLLDFTDLDLEPAE